MAVDSDTGARFAGPVQQPLTHIALREGMRFSSWYETADHQLPLAQLKHLVEQPGHAQVFLWGEAETGKTHLLEATCAAAWENNLRAACFPLKEVARYGVTLLAGSEQLDVLCVDDVDAILGEDAWERALFKMINLARENAQRLVLGASANPRDLQCGLADLQSRLPWGNNFQLLSPEEADRRALLKFRANQRGFDFADQVIDYIYHRYPRNLKSLIAILDKLDEASLSQHRRITIPLVKEVLEAE